MCLNIFPPSFVWCAPERTPKGFAPAPLPQIKYDINANLIFRCSVGDPFLQQDNAAPPTLSIIIEQFLQCLTVNVLRADFNMLRTAHMHITDKNDIKLLLEP
jgi:hypothetical protein